MATHQETYDQAKVQMEGILANADAKIAGQLAENKLSPLEVTKQARFKIMKAYEVSFSKLSLDPKAKTDSGVKQLLNNLEIEYKKNLAKLEENKKTYLEIVAYLNRMTELKVLMARTKKIIGGFDPEDEDSPTLILAEVNKMRVAIGDIGALPLPSKDRDLLIGIRNETVSIAKNDLDEMTAAYENALRRSVTTDIRIHRADIIVARIHGRKNNLEVSGQSTPEEDVAFLRSHLALLTSIKSKQKDLSMMNEIALVEKNIQEALDVALGQLRERVKNAKNAEEKRAAEQILSLARSNRLAPDTENLQNAAPKQNESELRFSFGDIRKTNGAFEQYMGGGQWLDVTPTGQAGPERDKELLAYEDAAKKTEGKETRPRLSDTETAVASAKTKKTRTDTIVASKAPNETDKNKRAA